MSSIVWCGRAPFHVEQNQTEVQALVDSARMAQQTFIWLDSVAGNEQFMINPRFVSSVCNQPGYGPSPQS